MSEEKIFIEKFGKKYFCLRQRNNIIQCQLKNKTKNCLNSGNRSEHCSIKKGTLDKEKSVNHNQLKVEENGIYKTIDKLENMVSYKVSYNLLSFIKIICFT